MKADSSTVRLINQNSILQTIYENEGISKADLATRLKLSKPSVSRNVYDLIEIGIVKEQGEGESAKSGGRKPTRLSFNKDFQYIASVDISMKRPICAVGDLRGNLLKMKKLDISRSAPEEQKRQSISEELNNLLAELCIPTEKLGLIIISQPGQIGANNEVIYIDSLHHPWTEIGLREYLQECFNTPILLRNEVQMAALGEMTMGDAKQFQSMLYVACGIGLGSSIIYKGELFQGENYGAGELGAFLMPDGRRLGQVVSMDGLLEHISGICNKVMDFEEVVERSLAGDTEVNRGLRDIGHILGQRIYNCCIMMGIPTVIFGGDYLKLGPAFIESIEETMNQSFFPTKLTIQKSSLNEAAGIFGTFVIARETILQNMIT